MKGKILFLPCLLFFSIHLIPLVKSFYLGHSPSILDFGEVRPGEKRVMELYLITDHTKDLIVDLNAFPPPFHVFNPNYHRSYDFDPFQASEEDVSSWIEFTENPIVVPPQRRYFPEAALEANKRSTLILKAPKNAEPGYHAGSISFTPKVMSEGAGYKVAIITLSQPLFIFKVPGKVERSAEIIDFSSTRVSEEKDRIGVLVRNNGTVTISVKIDSVNVSRDGILIASLESTAYTKIKPNQTSPLYIYWDVRNSTPGVYDVSVKISWLTGSRTGRGKIELLPYKKVVPLKIQERITFPIWLFVTVLLLILYILYKRRG